MVAWPFWALLLVVFGIAVAWRLRRGSTLESHAVRLAWPELSIGVLALLALAFHCLVMFLPPLVPPIQAVQGLAGAIAELGVISQLAYWLPAVVLLVMLRGIGWPILVALAAALLAVGATMFWPFPLGIHLVTIFAATSLVIVIATQLVRLGAEVVTA